MLIKDFVRQLNTQILTEYCKHKNIPFTTPKNKKPEEIATAFVKCLEKIGMENKGKVELDFQDIDVIANERGSLMLAEYGKNLFASLPQALQEDMNAYDKALWAFIKEEALFDKVSTEYVIEYTAGWTAFNVKSCPIEDVLDKEEELGSAVGRYFRETESRGNLCKAEYIEKDGNICYVAYPQDYMNRDITYQIDEKLNKRASHQPVFKVYFLYKPKENRLCIKSTKFRGKTKKAIMAKIFADVVMGQTLKSEDGVRYNLSIIKEKIKNRDYHFTYPPEDGVQEIKVVSVKFRYIGQIRTITLEVGKYGSNGLEEISEWIHDLNLPLQNMEIVQVKIKVKFNRDIKRSRGVVTATLTPYSCDLGMKKLEQKFSEYLYHWNLDTPHS